MASIRKLRDGRYQAQFRPVPGGKQVTRTTRRKTDAQRWLDEQTARVVTGAYVDPSAGRVTLGAFYNEWSARQIWEDGTRRSMDHVVGTAPFKDIPLRLLRPSHFESWIKGMQQRGLAPATIKSRMNGVRSVLRGATRDRLLVGDPSAGVGLPRQRRAAAAMQIPTAQQVGRILEAAEPQMRPVIALCAFAGLRLGEAIAVQVSDIDFLRRELQVQRQAQRADGGGVSIRPPKYGSERTVYIPDGLATILAEHIGDTRCADEPPGWLYRSSRGTPPRESTIFSRWQRALRAAGEVGIRVHDLRHFYASGLIAAGCDVVTVQRALGHSVPSTTLNTYSHLWPKAEDRTRKAAAAMLAEALGARRQPQATSDSSQSPL